MATVYVQARVTHPALTSVALGGGHRGLFLVSLSHWPSHLQILWRCLIAEVLLEHSRRIVPLVRQSQRNGSPVPPLSVVKIHCKNEQHERHQGQSRKKHFGKTSGIAVWLLNVFP